MNLIKTTSLIAMVFFAILFSFVGAQSQGCNVIGNSCPLLWEDRVMGRSLGERNSIINYDFDGDGASEIIVNTNNYNGGNVSWWFVLKYNVITDQYDKVYLSPYYDSYITKMEMYDLDGDSDMELVLGLENEFVIIDLNSFTEVERIDLGNSWDYTDVKDITLGDIDSDGALDLVLCSNEFISAFDPIDFSEKFTLEIEAGYLDVGNVDDDADIETVLSNGRILEIDSDGNYTEEYNLNLINPNDRNFVELSDLDNDAKLEAIIGSSSNDILVADVEINSVKFTIILDITVDALEMVDLNDDGVDEIVYGDDQWGSLYAHNSSDGSLIWELDNPEHGVTGICIGDFDGDNSDEIVWGSGSSSSGSDYLFIHDANNLLFEWQSRDIVGPYYAIEIADIDQDGSDEIIAISLESESGYESGVLSIYDAESKVLEFVSAIDLFEDVWDGIFNLEVYDHNNDGDLDIVVAAGILYDATIWVVDGSTYNVETFFEYDFNSFEALAINDIDMDGTAEFICSGEKKLYVINSNNFSIEFQSEELQFNVFASGVLSGNVDNDPEDEIILCKSLVYKFDGPSYSMLTSESGVNYTSINLFDWDNNGSLEIVAGTNDGNINILNGSDLSVIESFPVSTQSINGIEFNSKNPLDMEFFIVSSDDQVMMVARNGEVLAQNTFTGNIGRYDAIEISDSGDYPNIILGTQYGLLEMRSTCANCFIVDAQTFPSCVGVNNGSIQIQVLGADTIPIYYNWERLEDNAQGSGESSENIFSLDDLGAGTYSITVYTDTPESATIENVIIEELIGAVFEFIEIGTNNSINGAPSGSLDVFWEGGEGPFTVSWVGPVSGNMTSVNQLNYTIPDLPTGEYVVEVRDANNELISVQINLPDDELPLLGCEEPMDIIILNLVSNAIDGEEYGQSKDYFISFLQSLNLGFTNDDSQAAIVEWSSKNEQDVKVELTGSFAQLLDYENLPRSYSNGTDIIDALLFARTYLLDNGRPDATKTIIFTFDGCPGFSAANLAEDLKEEGFLIADIGIDYVYNSSSYRAMLTQAASSKDLAFFGDNFIDIDPIMLHSFLSIYNCTSNSSTTYFERDGALTIDEVVLAHNCPYPEFVDITFTVEALSQLSIPGGTPVSFYHNDPTLFGASYISTFIIPCDIPVGTSETFTITLPMEQATHLYAVLNDDASVSPSFDLPVTELVESFYQNNIDDYSICVDQIATLQAFISAQTPSPICENLVLFNVDICNISEVDAFNVLIDDNIDEFFSLQNSIFNDNGCSSESSGSYDIPAGCCITITLTYDTQNSEFGYYSDFNVQLNGPSNQIYIDFNGNNTTSDDVFLDGEIDCDDPVITIKKEVNHDITCEDHTITYFFEIVNDADFPVQGLQFYDLLPDPLVWLYKPYDIIGMSVGELPYLDGTEVSFIIDEIEAGTTATFSIDAYVGGVSSDLLLENVAEISGIPDYYIVANVIQSNASATTILADREINVVDTLYVLASQDSVDLSAMVSGTGDVFWTTSKDGYFSNEYTTETIYYFGEEEILDTISSVFIEVDTYCGSKGEVIYIKRICDLETTTFNLNQLCPDDLQSDQLFISWEGGRGPYSTVFDGENEHNISSPIVYSGLDAGAHQIILRDTFGCEILFDFEIELLELPEVVAVPLHASCNEEFGSIELSLIGNGPFAISGDIVSDDVIGNIVFEDLSADNYAFVVTDQNGCISEINVELENIPGLQLTVSPTNPECGDALGDCFIEVFEGSAPYNISGDLSGVNTTNEISLIDLPASSYTVVITDASDCSETVNFVIDEMPIPIIDIQTECDSTGSYSVIFVAEGEYLLQNNLGLTIEEISDLNYVISDVIDGTQVEIIAIHPTSMCEETFYVEIPDCECLAVANAGVNESLNCDGLGLTIGGGSSVGSNFTYQWYDVNGVALGDEMTIQIFEEGVFTIVVEDSVNGCSTSDEVVITAPDLIEGVDISLDPLNCFEDINAQLYAEVIEGGTAPFDYQLNGSDKQESGLFENLAANTYELLVTDDEGCTLDTTIIIEQPEQLQLFGIDELVIQNLQDTVINLETNIDLQLIESIIWNPAQNCSDCLSIDITGIEESQIYTVTLIDVNGCSVTKEISIRIEDDILIYLPNVFAPSSSTNGVFFPQSGNDEIYIDELTIFDRWGSRIFSNHGFYPNDKTNGWDGNFKGKEAISGVYAYYMSYSVNNENYTRWGDITLLR